MQDFFHQQHVWQMSSVSYPGPIETRPVRGPSTAFDDEGRKWELDWEKHDFIILDILVSICVKGWSRCRYIYMYVYIYLYIYKYTRCGGPADQFIKSILGKLQHRLNPLCWIPFVLVENRQRKSYIENIVWLVEYLNQLHDILAKNSVQIIEFICRNDLTCGYTSSVFM